MMLDLREIIEIPGASLPFACELDTSRLDFPCVLRYVTPPRAEGVVRNSAGALTLTGVLHAEMICICDRCMSEYSCVKDLPLDVALTADPEDEESAELYPLTGDALDLDDLLETCFILDMESKHLCREDCAGLCETCGANLNLGPCSCKAKPDPRMAVLEQLLDNKDE